jgi:hypothetical protein
MTDEEVEHVAETVKDICRANRKSQPRAVKTAS